MGTASITHTISGTIETGLLSRSGTSQRTINGHVHEVVDLTTSYVELGSIATHLWKTIVIVNVGAEEIFVRIQTATPGDPHDFLTVPVGGITQLYNANDGTTPFGSSNIYAVALRAKTAASTVVVHGVW